MGRFMARGRGNENIEKKSQEVYNLIKFLAKPEKIATKTKKRLDKFTNTM